LLDLVTSRSRDGLWTIVDESFVEASPELSVSGATIERLVVLRSFGKFYGLPGVRLGFVIAEPVAIKRLRALLGDWPVSADAVVIGRAAYLDESWCVQTRERLERDAHALDRSLAPHGLTTVGGTSLFRLISTPLAGSLFTGLCERGILTRPFQERRGSPADRRAARGRPGAPSRGAGRIEDMTANRRDMIAGALAVGVGASAKPSPRRVASLNACLDAMLVHLADRSQIAALSHYAREEHSSTVAATAKTLPFTWESAEEIIALEPDLILASKHSALATRNALKRLHVPVERFAVSKSIDESLARSRRSLAFSGIRNGAGRWSSGSRPRSPLPRRQLELGD
jgi:hypothetical protein